MTATSMTPAGAPPAEIGPVGTKPRWNTLQLLKGSRVAILVLIALLLIAVIVGTTVHRDAMKTVGKDAAPSIIAAQHIKAALAAMDADVVDDLLLAASARPSAANAAADPAADPAAAVYEARRIEAAKALLAAAENITYGESERVPIQTLQVGMGTYERLIQKARDLHESGNAGFLVAYLDTARLMDQTLLPAADALDHANNDVLERTYEGQSSKSFSARAAVTVAGLVVLFGMIAAQAFLSFRTRRTFNPLLLLATLLTAALALYALTAMGDEQHQLKVAKEDAFSSIRALWRARAVAYQANGEQRRYLLDPADAAEDQRTFIAESNSLAKLPSAQTLDQVVSTEANGHSVEHFTGYLADELNNITFPGERDAAILTLVNFERYIKVDGDVRRLERSGQHKQAVELCLGRGPGHSNWAFEQSDASLVKTLDINQGAFDAAVESGLSALQSLEIKAAVGAVLISVLVFLGLAGRIREYD